MSISDQITRLNNAKAAIKQAISNKGVEVSDGAKLDEYPALIDSIEVGGGSDDFLAMRTMNGTNMNNLFYGYQGINLDVSNLDVSNATDISGMFEMCQRLQTLTGLDTWETKNVTNMGNMFYNCQSLTSLDLSSFDTSKVTDMIMMFSYCSKLETLDISNFDMGNVTDVPHTTSYMFGDCSKLHTLRLDNCDNDTINKIITSEEFPTNTITGVTRRIYVNPDNIEGLTAPEGWVFVDSDGNEIVPEKPDPTVYQEGEYRDNRYITKVYTLVTSNHTDLSYMFSGCPNLQTINGIEQWDTSNVTDMSGMFADCTSLVSLDLSNFDTSNVTDMNCMFMNCTNLKRLDLSNFDMSKTNASLMFIDCNNLQELRLDYCSAETVEKIIYESDLPTNTITGVTRKIYVKQANAAGLTAPINWVFEYIS